MRSGSAAEFLKQGGLLDRKRPELRHAILTQRRPIGSPSYFFRLVKGRGIVYDKGDMMENGWNSVQIHAEERPQVTTEDLQIMAEALDPDEFDEPVQEFLKELEHGGDPEDLRRAATLLLQDEIDFSPELRTAGVEPDEQLIELLLAVGADPNARNPYGELPLHLAASYGYTSIVEMLLTAGADRFLRNARGQLAVELATLPQLVQLLTPPGQTH